MGRGLKILLGVLAAVVVVAGVAVFLLVRNLDSIVEDAIESYGSALTGTPVRVDSVSIGLREGRGTIRGLTVGNPDGFDADHAFAWKEVTLDLDPQSLTALPYRVDVVSIQSPEVTFELNEAGKANLKVLQDRLAGDPTPPEETPTEGPPPRLRIDRFVFEKGTVHARTEAVGGKNVEVELPPLSLEDLGGANGATPSELGQTVLLAYTRQVLQTVARRELGRRAEDLIDEKLGGEEGEAAKRLLDRVLDR